MGSNSSEQVIEVEHLTRRYGETVAVDGISFSVARGEVFGLIGPNGAGKTTTVELLQGLRRRHGGRVSVLGLDPERSLPLRRRLGSQLQSSALPARIRVGEAVELFAALSPTPLPVVALLDEWGLTELASRPFAGLSGGQRQRLFLALALVGGPEIVFLDELTSGLDPEARRQTWQLIERIRDRGTTIVLVSHIMEEAERLCDRIGVVAGGRLMALGTPAELIDRAGHGTEVSFRAGAVPIGFLCDLEAVDNVSRHGDRTVVRGDRFAPIDVAAALAAAGIRPDDYRTHRPDLEDALLALTAPAGAPTSTPTSGTAPTDTGVASVATPAS